MRGTGSVQAGRKHSPARRHGALFVLAAILSTLVHIGPGHFTKTALATSTYETDVVNESPGAYYRLDESSGSTAADSSGNGVSGTYESGVSYSANGAITSDASDTAVTSSGSNGAVSVSDNSNLDPTSQITLDAWFKVAPGTLNSSKEYTLIGKGYTSYTSPYWQYTLSLCDCGSYPKDAALRINIGGTVHDMDNINSGWVYGYWNHIVGTYDGSDMKMYVNGVLVGTQAESGSLTTYATPMGIGSDLLSGSNLANFPGDIDEVAVYPTALSAAHIATHYEDAAAAGTAPTTTTDYPKTVNNDGGPAGYWRLGESTGEIAHDALGHGHPARYSASGVTLGAAHALGTDLVTSTEFNGSGSAEVPDTSSLDPSSQLSLEAWFYVSSGALANNKEYTLIGKGYTSYASPYWQYTLSIYDGGSYPKDAALRINTGGTMHDMDNANSGWSYDTWNQIVGTYDGSHRKMYVNGKLVGTQAQSGSLTSYPTNVGIASDLMPGSNLANFPGDMQDVAIYSSPLSIEQIKAHFTSGGHTSAPTTSNVDSKEHLGLKGNAAGACSNSGQQQGAKADPVDTESGNFSEAYTDVAIAGRSCPLEIARTYNSLNASTDGPFGYGWTYNYAMALSCSSTTATITQETGAQVSFATSGSCSSGTWTPAAPRYITTLSYSGGTWTFKRQNRDTYTFNSSGQLTSITDLNGYTTSLTYSSGKLSTITDPAGRTLSLTWTGSHITGVTDANVSPNRTVSYSYDGSGNLQDVTDVAGGDTNFAYDGSHRITTIKDPVCEAIGGGCPGVQNHYDGNGRVDWQKDQLNRETTFSYDGTPGDATGGTTTTTDPKGNVTVEGYEYGVRTFITRGYGTADAATTSVLYDPDTLAFTGILDANGNLTTQTVDSSGNVLTTTDPLGRVTTNTYNSFNELLTTEDGNGITTTNTYDGNGNLTGTSRPVSGTSCTCEVITYNHANGTYPGDVTSADDGDSKTTYYHYDANGYRDEIKDPNGNVTGTVRDNDGFVTSSYTAKANCTWNSSPPTGCSSTYKTTYTSNAFGQPLTVTDPLSHVTTFGYDANGNKTAVQDGNGNTTTYRYDVANELCWVLPGGTSSNSCASVPSNGRATTYNDDGTVVSQKDGKGNTILSYDYDALARVTTITDALSNVTTLTYDANGNTLTKQDPGGNCATPSKCTTMTYDADNELATVSYSDGVTPDMTSITYDDDGQRTGMADGTGSPTWSYDNLHRLTSYTSGNGDTVSYTYNLRNEPLTIAYPNSVGTVTYGYDNGARMTSVEDWNSKTTTFGYDANNNLTSSTVPSTTNVTDTFGFNAGDQMTSVSDANGATLSSATYTRDANGQLASDSSHAANQQNYKYTALNQLCYAGSSTSNACSSPPSNSYPYAFDNADNLTTMENAAHSGTNTQQFNNADELCWTVAGASGNSCGSPPAGATTFGYDDRGNRTSLVPNVGSATCWGYDQGGELTSMKTGTGSSCTSPSTVGTYAYDGDGLRTSKTVAGTTTHFTWDESGSLPLLLQEKAGSTTSYIYGPRGLPAEQIVGSTTTYLHHDQIGSTVLITDSAGATGTATTNTFDPYGNQVSTSGSLTTNLMYAGQYLDSESGLYYLRARYMDPTTGQFLNVDPAVSTSMEPFGYAVGDPMNMSDLTGLAPAPPAPSYEGGGPRPGDAPGPATSFKQFTGSNAEANALGEKLGYGDAHGLKGAALDKDKFGGEEIYIEKGGNIFVAKKGVPQSLPDDVRNYVPRANGDGIANINDPSVGEVDSPLYLGPSVPRVGGDPNTDGGPDFGGGIAPGEGDDPFFDAAYGGSPNGTCGAGGLPYA